MSLLQTFCLTGVMPAKEDETVVKELLKYRLLDIAAFVYGVGSECSTVVERGKVPLVDKMVCFLFENLLVDFEYTALRDMQLWQIGPKSWKPQKSLCNQIKPHPHFLMQRLRRRPSTSGFLPAFRPFVMRRGMFTGQK